MSYEVARVRELWGMSNGKHGLSRLSLLSYIIIFFAIPVFAAQSSYDLLERANALYRNGKFNQAIILYHKAEERGADPTATSFNIANS